MSNYTPDGDSRLEALYRAFLAYLEKLGLGSGKEEKRDNTVPTEKLWAALANEGNYDLIEKLRRAESGEGGFGTIIVPKQGFSDDDTVHNMVIDWLNQHDINVVNTRVIIASLENALHESRGEEVL